MIQSKCFGTLTTRKPRPWIGLNSIHKHVVFRSIRLSSRQMLTQVLSPWHLAMDVMLRDGAKYFKEMDKSLGHNSGPNRFHVFQICISMAKKQHTTEYLFVVSCMEKFCALPLQNNICTPPFYIMNWHGSRIQILFKSTFWKFTNGFSELWNACMHNKMSV